MHESFTGNRIIKGYNLEQVAVDRFKANQKKFIGHFMRVIRSTESPGPIIEFLAAIGVSILLLYLAGSVSPTEFMVYIGALLMMYGPVKAIIRVQSQLHQARAATERVFELLATQSALADPPHPMPLKAAGAEIQFDNVSFSYGDKLVLRNIQLRVEPGRMVALVGSSGAGKSDKSPPPLLRSDAGRHPHWRRRPAPGGLARSPFANRRGHAGSYFIQRHYSPKHRLWTPAGRVR
jgi:subfamily B ATP-binding cassette protein MsbA